MPLSFILLMPSSAQAAGCYDGVVDCDKGWFRSGSSAPSTSSTGGKVKINPAAVPTAKGFGIETITFSSEVDFGLVRGNGRIGAAISPSNSEETFFGPPGFALSDDLLQRKQSLKKFPSQKMTLAGAINLAEKQGSTFKSYSLKLGMMGRYNKLTHSLTPGLGLSGTMGPISFGGSYYDDQTQLDPEDADGDGYRPLYLYQVRTYSVGLFLSSLVLDYSHLELNTVDVAAVNLYTASLFFKKFIFTASRRVEKSVMPQYNYETKMLEYNEIKEETFGGIQYSFTKNLMLGALYNYYLLREYSITATLFF